jgi:ABC-type lipoprotein release transport system permease subunit
MIFSNVLLIFMISLQFGSYDMMINNTLQAFSGHIQVQHQGYNDNPKLRKSIAAIAPLADNLRHSVPGTRIAARAATFALVSSDQRSLGVQIIGVEPEFEPGVSTLPGLVKEGRFLKDSNVAEIVIGSVLARNLKVNVGDELTLLGGGRLAYFQEVFAMRDHGNTIAIAVDELSDVPTALAKIDNEIKGKDNLMALDWPLLHPGLKQAIKADMSSAWFMYGLLIILVAFSVLNTQLMSVLERTREFGVITALGIKPRKLASLVMLETALMALMGLVIGVAIGWMVATYLNTTGFHYPGMEDMAEKFNLPDRVYPSVTFFSMILGPGIVFLFSLLASVYPSLRLFRLEPVEAMRAV